MLNITINLVQVDLATIIIWHMRNLALRLGWPYAMSLSHALSPCHIIIIHVQGWRYVVVPNFFLYNIFLKKIVWNPLQYKFAHPHLELESLDHFFKKTQLKL